MTKFPCESLTRKCPSCVKIFAAIIICLLRSRSLAISLGLAKALARTERMSAQTKLKITMNKMVLVLLSP
jgi:hypothetical protein